MDALVVLFWIILGVFLAYVVPIAIKFGILKSISISVYSLPKKWRFLFTSFACGFAIPVMIFGLLDKQSILLFIAGGAICFVGVAHKIHGDPTTDKDDYDNHTRTVHMWSAYIGVIVGQLSILFDYGLWYVNVFFVVVGGTLFLMKYRDRIKWRWLKNWIEKHDKILQFIEDTHIYWVEILAFGTIIFTFLHRLFQLYLL